tara:strand:- start:3822 stop:4643 length:822 start_codon:yes stop_codon:yes gene_type:complete
MAHKLYLNKKNPNKKNPNVSVVTCVLDGDKVLEKTIKNVLEQSYRNFEYIVVYTLSNDDTWEIIKKYSKKIDKIIINDEVGIYQAFNIGLKYANGKWINYMNAGDSFKSRNTLKDIFDNRNYDSDVLYSGSYVEYPNFKKYDPALPLNHLNRQMPFSHQSSFVKLNLHKKNKFNTFYNLSGDYDFFSKLEKKNYKFKKINKTISVSMAFGVADRRKVLTIYQNMLIANKYWNLKFLDKIFFYYSKIIYFSFTSLIKIFIPKKILLLILKLKYK